MASHAGTDKVVITAPDAGLDPALEYPSIPPPADAGYGENEGFWVWDDETKVGMHLWLGPSGDPSLRLGRITIWLPDGRTLTRIQDGPGTTARAQSNGVLSAEPLEPYQSWVWRLLGSTQPTTAEELRRGALRDGPKVLARVAAKATMIAPPWVNGGFEDPADYANSDYAKAQGGFRLEQFLRAEGTVQVGQEAPLRFSGLGNRTHRKGVRSLSPGILPGHFWTAPIFPSGRAFYVQLHGAEGAPPLTEECWVREGDTFHKAQVVDPAMFRPVLAGETFTFQLRSSLGTATIEGERVAQSFQTLPVATGGGITWGIDYDRPAGDLAMDQGIMRYRWDGETACNFIERSLPISGLARR